MACIFAVNDYNVRMSEREKDHPTPFQRGVCWLALSSLCLVFIVALLFSVLYGIGWLFITLEPVLLPVVVAGILAYLLSPCVQWVQKYVKKRVPAVLLVLMLTALGLSGLGLMIVPPLVRQTTELVNERQLILERAVETGREMLQNNTILQNVVDALYSRTLDDAARERAAREAEGLEASVPEPGNKDEELFGPLNPPAVAGDASTSKEKSAANDEQALFIVGFSPSGRPLMEYERKVLAIIEYNSDYLTDKALAWLTAGTRAIYGASAFLIGLVMIPVFLFYFLLESEAIKKNWARVLPLRASRFKDEVVGTLQEINMNIVAFVRGQMLVSLIDGVILGIALMCLGLPYAITIAAAAALLGIIPYIGMISTSIPALLIAWFTWQDVSMVVAVGATFLAVSQFDGWILQPKVVGNSMKMHDLTVMFSVLFWSMVFGGVIGALLAVPLTASIKVVFRRYVWSNLRADGTFSIVYSRKFD